ncbi:MAG: pectic acid lyase [Planctomycetaceae bacterium]|nr:pectic acid lyase [Planctomycetaceae bacterium]
MLVTLSGLRSAAAESLADEVEAAMKKAATFYYEQVANHGGYVYHYSPDLKIRWGEGPATIDQIWVQPPGTPRVGLAYLRAWEATGDEYYLNAATSAAKALLHGQLQSGAWTNAIDFNPRGDKLARYQNGKGGGKNRNFSSLDDGISQTALRFLMQTDRALQFNHAAIHEAVQIGLDALLAAQFSNGAFPQGWDEEGITPHPRKKANFPDYDWRSENRIKNYWDLYTLNDDLAGYVFETLNDAWEIYRHPKYRQAIVRLGDFLIDAQLPNPQPAWAQQYNYDMQPSWARAFEPPGVSGRESETAMEVLMKIYNLTGDDRYLDPIPKAITYLKRSRLPDGRYARYYELETNRPLYMNRQGKRYFLTYDDSDLPSHYGWKTESHIEELEAQYRELVRNGTFLTPKLTREELETQVQTVLRSLDDSGRWILRYDGRRLIGQAKFREGDPYISSEVFSENLELLAQYLMAR